MLHGARLSPRLLLALLVGVAAPLLLTEALLLVGFNDPRNYIFLYLGVVAVLGVAAGITPAAVAATVSFLLVDYLFVPPFHTLTIANSDDVVNLVVFFGAAGLVGTLGSRRRNAQFRAEALTSELQGANLELASLNHQLAEAASLAAQLADTEQQIRILEETDRLRHEFLANISHELRTPLAGILTGTTTILERGSVPLDLAAELTLIVAEARRLGRLVSDLLDITRIQGGTVDLQLGDVDVAEAIEVAVNRLHLLHPEREVVVTRRGEGALDARADWGRLGQILDNLLGNAQRVAPLGTPLRVVSGRDGDVVVTHVIDHGPGVDEALRPQIFERFVRGADQIGAGTGLGLAIVRGLAEIQGGNAWLEPAQPGQGADFAFSVPVGGIE